MLSVVCWKWKPANGYRSSYGPETVNILKAMVKRNYDKPHRFICVTDDPAGLDDDIKIVPLWDTYSELQNPFGPLNPSCYRRLKMFSPEAEEFFGKRFVSLDLDVVITDNLSPLWDRPEEFIAWGDTNPTTYYNGSMMMLTAGSRPQVWQDFNPHFSPIEAKRAGQFGSDQAWISYKLGPREARWTIRDGVYSYRNHLSRSTRLNPGTRLVIFHGHIDPWSKQAQRHSWVIEHYACKRRYKGMVDVQSINLQKAWALLTDGRVIKITAMLDENGEETKDHTRALAFVAGEKNEWFSGAVSHYSRISTQ